MSTPDTPEPRRLTPTERECPTCNGYGQVRDTLGAIVECERCSGRGALKRTLTPTERLHEVTMAAMTRAPSPPEHSVEITRNAKGVAQFEITVRGYDVAEVLDLALAAFGSLGAALPYPETNGGTA